MPVVQFAPFASVVQPAFWHELTRLKIDVLRLSDESISLTGSYSVGRSIRDRETGQDVALGCNLSLGADAFDKDPRYVHIANDRSKLTTHTSIPAWSISARGVFKNYNTFEDFKAADKAALFNTVADEVRPTLSVVHLPHTHADVDQHRRAQGHFET